MADPNSSDAPVHTDAQHVRAGETTGVMRYVLGISLVLAIVILSAVWLVPALLAK